MARALVNGIVIAESEHTVQLEGSTYFPPDALKREYFVDSDHATVCPHKGTAGYYHVEIDGTRIDNAAWVYPNTTTDYAKPIEGHVAFYPSVTVEA